MKYYCMWHPVMKWGGPVPVLLPHKRQACLGTGLTLAKIREMGWKWIVVTVNEPTTMHAATLEEAVEQVKHWTEICEELQKVFVCCDKCMTSEMCKQEGRCDRNYNGYR